MKQLRFTINPPLAVEYMPTQPPKEFYKIFWEMPLFPEMPPDDFNLSYPASGRSGAGGAERADGRSGRSGRSAQARG